MLTDARHATIAPALAEIALPRRLSRLVDLASNLWWTWHPDAQELFQQIDNTLWIEVYHNPVKFLRQAKRKTLNAAVHEKRVLELYDRTMQAMRMETDRPVALREAILACRNGGTVSVIGVYAGFINMFPMGAVMNRSLTIRAGQTHVHRYLRPLLERIERGEIDPSFVVTHRMTLDQAPLGYQIFRDKQDECIKVVLKP